jgi:BASS family bile acid:Na+ symporter
MSKLSSVLMGLSLAGVAVAGASGGAGPAAGVGLAGALAALAVAAAASRRYKNLAFTLWVFVAVAAAMYFPWLFQTWGGFRLTRSIAPLVQVIMLGMGMTMTYQDFVGVVRMPRGVLVGTLLQFTIMPVLGWLFAQAMGLDAEVTAGLILIGACAGGVASNVITYLAGGNVPLSVSMTACSTIAAPLLTPLAMKLLAGQYVPVEFVPMATSILSMIVAPTAVGLILNQTAPAFVARLSRPLPLISMFGVWMIIAITVAASRDDLLQVGVALLLAAMCQNAAGFLLGYGGSRLLGLNERDSRTVSIEVGLQNGGMATGLAFEVLKSPVAALASAVYGPWSAVAGSALASYWKKTAAALDASAGDDMEGPAAARAEQQQVQATLLEPFG